MLATPTRLRWLPQPAILWVIAVAWALAVAAEVTGRAQVLHHDALVDASLPYWAALGLFLVAWQAMVAAMMLPSSLSLIVLFSRVAATQPRPGAARAAFLLGYTAVWSAFGAVAFTGDLVVHRGVEAWTWLDERPWLIGGGALLLAGAFQFSDLKDRCLRECRHPGAYLMRHYRRGVSEAFRIGVGHGRFCLGCCWAIMLVGFAAGVANLAWMAPLTLLMVFEKTARGGRRAVVPIGVGLCVLGLLVIVAPDPFSHLLAVG